jgi:hypothetical protein
MSQAALHTSCNACAADGGAQMSDGMGGHMDRVANELDQEQQAARRTIDALMASEVLDALKHSGVLICVMLLFFGLYDFLEWRTHPIAEEDSMALLRVLMCRYIGALLSASILTMLLYTTRPTPHNLTY